MRITGMALWLPKEGNTEEEYEDAVCPCDPVDQELAQFRCAVADGATETSFAGLWARLLVEGYAGELFDLARLRQDWTDQVSEKKLPWYAEQKVISGAFAALVGLTVTDEQRWRAEAIGDSCLMHARDGRLLLSFPLTRSEEFTNSPYLLSTHGTESGGTLPEQKDGDWQTGDLFLLMTDAIAHWTLKREEDHHDALDWLLKLNGRNALIDFAASERHKTDAEGRPILRNDDITLLRLQITA